MLELDPRNTLGYLQKLGWIDRQASARVEPLAWGVSNVVLRVTPTLGPPFVVKQSRPQLRTKDPWFSRLDRVFREVEIMRLLVDLLPAGVVPSVLFEDRDNYLFAMEAAPAEHVVWKQLLLEGHTDQWIAGRLGDFLATIHRETANRPELARSLADHEIFDQLRVDPFYRRVAAVSTEAAAAIARMIEEMFATRVCLVHADFSPKNVLVAGERLVLVDYETGHFGDPAFDLGFFLSHLMLKGVLHADRFNDYVALTTIFWDRYLEGLHSLANQLPFAPANLLRRTSQHLAGCMLARIDGTSKVDYLPATADQNRVREFCRSLFRNSPADWTEVVGRLRLLLS